MPTIMMMETTQPKGETMKNIHLAGPEAEGRTLGRKRSKLPSDGCTGVFENWWFLQWRIHRAPTATDQWMVVCGSTVNAHRLWVAAFGPSHPDA